MALLTVDQLAVYHRANEQTPVISRAPSSGIPANFSVVGLMSATALFILLLSLAKYQLSMDALATNLKPGHKKVCTHKQLVLI